MGPTWQSVLIAMTPSDTIPHMSLRGAKRRGNPFPRNDIVRYCFPICHCEEVPKGPTWQSVLIGVTPSDTIPHMSLRGAQRRGNPALLRADFFIHENPAAQNC